MKYILEVNNKTNYKISKKFFLDIFKCTIEQANVSFIEDAQLELSVAVVNENEMWALNKQYRKKDKPTDVLSFFEHDNLEQMEKVAIHEKEIFLGELILCPTYIEKNAKEDGEVFEYALAYITSHGVLHLLGYPHGKKMFSLQKKVANILH